MNITNVFPVGKRRSRKACATLAGVIVLYILLKFITSSGGGGCRINHLPMDENNEDQRLSYDR